MPSASLAAAAAASSTPWCAPFPCRGGGAATARTRGLPSHGGHNGCGRPLGRAAGLVGGGIAAAFFASLERCSCVEVRTKEDDDTESEAAAPLMTRRDRGGSPATAAPAATSRGGRRASGKGSKRRGLGCCENNAVN